MTKKSESNKNSGPGYCDWNPPKSESAKQEPKKEVPITDVNVVSSVLDEEYHWSNR